MYVFRELGLWTDKFLSKLDRPGYRHAYVSEHVKTWIARQIKVIRESRGWSQAALGEACNKPQSAIARLENPDYGQMTLQTLLEVAKSFDVALVVKFVDYERFLLEYENLSESDLTANKYNAKRMRGTAALGGENYWIAANFDMGSHPTPVVAISHEKPKIPTLETGRPYPTLGQLIKPGLTVQTHITHNQLH